MADRKVNKRALREIAFEQGSGRSLDSRTQKEGALPPLAPVVRASRRAYSQVIGEIVPRDS